MGRNLFRIRNHTKSARSCEGKTDHQKTKMQKIRRKHISKFSKTLEINNIFSHTKFRKEINHQALIDHVFLKK